MMIVISWHYSVNASEQHRKLKEVDSFKRWPKRVLLFKTWEGRYIIGLQRISNADRKEYCYSKHERAGIL